MPLPFFLPSSSLVFWYLFTSWCNFPPSFHPSPRFLPSPFSLSHPPPLPTFLPYFLSPLHVSLVLPFYFHFLLNSISLGSSFLPSSFFPVSSLTPAFPSYFLPSFYCSSHFNLFCLSFLLSILFFLYFLVFILLPLLLCLPVLPISLLSFLPYILRPSCSPLFILLCPVLSPSSIFFAVLHFGFSLLPRTLHISTISSISSPLCSLYSVSGFLPFFSTSASLHYFPPNLPFLGRCPLSFLPSLYKSLLFFLFPSSFDPYLVPPHRCPPHLSSLPPSLLYPSLLLFLSLVPLFPPSHGRTIHICCFFFFLFILSLYRHAPSASVNGCLRTGR